MSSTDTRVVEMRFDNSQFENGIKSSMSYLEKLKASLDLKSSERSLQSLESAGKKFSLAGIGESVDKLNKKFSTLGIIGMTTVSNLTNSAINSIKGVTSSVVGLVKTGGINRALNIEAAKFQLQGLGVAWDDISEDINYGVKDTAYGLDAAAKVAAQLVASGVTLGDTMKSDLRAISGVAAMTNSTYEDIGQIFTTVAGNGRLMSDQLLQFSSRGLNVAAALATQLGKTESEIREMVSAGKIDFQTFATAMDNAFGEHAKEANNTFTGALSNMKAALSRLGAEVASPGLESLRVMINALTPVINDVHTALMPVIDDFNYKFKIAAEAVRIALEELDVEKKTEAIKAFFKALKPSATTLDKLKRSFNGVVAVLDIFAEIIKVTLPPLLNLLGFSVDTAGGSILDITAKIGDMLSTFRDWVLENQVVEKSFGLLGDGLTFVVDHLKTFISEVKETNFVNALLKNLGKLFNDAFSLIEQVVPGAADGINKFASAIKGLFGDVGLVETAQAATKMGDSFEDLGDAVETTSATLGGDTKKSFISFKDILNDIGNVLSLFTEKAKSVITFANGAKLITLAIGVVMVKFGIALTEFLKKLTKISTPMQALVGILDQVKLSIWAIQRTLQKNIASQAVKNFAEAILMIAGAIAILALIPDKSAIDDALLAIGLISVMLIAVSKGLSMIKADWATLGTLSLLFVSFATSLVIFGAALKKVTSIVESWNSTLEGITAVGVLTGLAATMVVFTKAMAWATEDLSAKVLLLIPVTAALYVFASGLQKLADLKIDNAISLVVSIIAFLGYMKIVATMSAWVNGGVAGTLLAMSATLWIFAASIEKMAKISIADVLSSLPGMIEAVVMIKALMVVVSAGSVTTAKAGVALLAMAVAIDLLIVAVKAFCKLSPAEIVKSLTMTAQLIKWITIFMVFTSLAGKNSAKAGVALLALAVSIDLLVIAIALLSALDPEAITTATIAVDSMIVFCSLMVAATHLVGQANYTIAMMAVLFGTLAGCIALLSFIDSDKLLTTTAAMDSVILSLSLLFAAIGQMGPVTGRAMATIGIIAALLTEISLIFALLSKLTNADDVLKIAESLSMVMVSIAAVMAVSAAIGTVGTAATTGLITIMEALAVMTGIMAVVGGILNYFGAGQATLDAINLCADILEAVGNALGGAIGGIVNGFLSSATANLGQIGQNLSDFATNIQGFLDAINGINPNAASSVLTLVEIVKNIKKINKEASGLTTNSRAGSSNNLSSAFSAIADALVDFSDKTKDLNVDRIKKAAEASSALNDVISNMPKEGGVWQGLFGTNTFASFGENLSNYADGLSEFNFVVSGEEFDVKAIESAAEASSALVELVNDLPDTGGWFQDVFGSYDMSLFGAQLADYAESLCDMNDALKTGKMDSEAFTRITDAADATQPLIELCNSLDPTGGKLQKWMGTSDFSTFGYNVKTYIDYLCKASNLLEEDTPDYDAIETARVCTVSLIDLLDLLDPTGGVAQFFTGTKDFSSFGENLASYGQSLKDFSDETKDVNATNLANAVTASENLINMLNRAETIGSRLSNGMGKFSETIKNYGIALSSYAKSIKDVDVTKVNKSVVASKQLSELSANVKGVNYSTFVTFGNGIAHLGLKMSEFYNNVKTLDTMKITALGDAMTSLNKIVKTLKNFDKLSFSNVSEAFREIGKISINAMKSEFDNGSTRIQASIKKIMDAAIQKVNEYKELTKTSGSYVVQGFLDGVNQKQSAVQNAGTKIGSLFLKKLNAALDEHSPSKETEQTGEYAVEGFLNGVSDGLESVSNLALNTGAAFGDSLKGGALDSIKDAGSTVKDKVTGVVSGALDSFSGLISQATANVNSNVTDSVKSTVSSVTSAATSSITSSSTTSAVTKATSSTVSKTAEETKKVVKVKYYQVGKIIVSALNSGYLSESSKLKYTTEQINAIGANVIKQVQKSLNDTDSIFASYYEATDDSSKATKATLAEAANAFIKFRDAVKESFESAASGFDEFTVDTEVTAETMIANLKSQIQGIKDYTANLQILAAEGISEAGLNYLIELGAKDGAAYAKALVYGGEEAIKEFNTYWKKRTKEIAKASNATASLTVDTTSAKKAASKTSKTTTKSKDSKKHTSIGTAVSTEIKDAKTTIKNGSEEVTKAETSALDQVNKIFEKSAGITVTKLAETTSDIQELVGKKYTVSDPSDIYILSDALGNLAAVDSDQLPTILDGVSTAVKNVYSSMSYGSGAAKVYADNMASASDTTYTTVTSATSAKNAIQALAKSLYLSTDAGQDAKKELKTYQKAARDAKTEMINLKTERDKFEKGSDNWIKWDQQYRDAKAKYKTAHEEYVDYVENTWTPAVESAYNDVYDSIVDTITDYVSPIKASCESGIEIFKDFTGEIEATEEEAGTTAQEALLNAMKTNTEEYTNWRNNLSKLGEMVDTGTLSEGLYEYVKGLGLSGSEYVAALAGMSNEQIAQANQYFEDSTKASSETFLQNFKDRCAKAEKYVDNVNKLMEKGIDIDTLQDILGEGIDSDTIDAILNMDDEQFADFKNTIESHTKKTAEGMADEIVANMAKTSGVATETTADAAADETEKATDKISDAATKSVETAGEDIADATTTATETMLQNLTTKLAEKAEEMQTAGETLSTSISFGILKGSSGVSMAAETTSEQASDGFETYLNETNGKSIGKNMDSGLVKGIKAGRSSVISAAVSVAVAAYAAACASLGVNSPSKKFEELGMYSDMGWANGLTKYASLVTTSATDTSDSVLTAVSDSANGIQKTLDSGFSGGNIHLTPVLDISQAQNRVSAINASLSSTIAADVNAIMAKSKTDRQMNAQLSKDISLLSSNIASVKESLDNGSISNMNDLMEQYFPQFSDGFYLDGTRVSSRVDSHITHNAIRRAKVW